jgi:uncharacterized protein YjbJ (UPF0337 family)
MDWNDRMQNDGAWQRFRGRIRETWGDVTDDDLDKARGNWDQLVGTIKQKTGETADAIERRFDEWAAA